MDLDGTLLNGNSLKIFMRHLPGVLVKRNAWMPALASIWWMGQRILRLVSHKKMKWHLCNIARRHLLEKDWESMAERMLGYVSPMVEAYLSGPANKECRKYIATAAMEEYALPLGRKLGFDGVLATRYSEDEANYEEMRGIKKREGIEGILNKKRLRMESFLTDHSDDLPTASAFPLQTILVNPSCKSLEIFRNAGITRVLS